MPFKWGTGGVRTCSLDRPPSWWVSRWALSPASVSGPCGSRGSALPSSPSQLAAGPACPLLWLIDSWAPRDVGKSWEAWRQECQRWGKSKQDKKLGKSPAQWRRAWLQAFPQGKICSNCCGKWKFGGRNRCLKNEVWGNHLLCLSTILGKIHKLSMLLERDWYFPFAKMVLGESRAGCPATFELHLDSPGPLNLTSSSCSLRPAVYTRGQEPRNSPSGFRRLGLGMGRGWGLPQSSHVGEWRSLRPLLPLHACLSQKSVLCSHLAWCTFSKVVLCWTPLHCFPSRPLLEWFVTWSH